MNIGRYNAAALGLAALATLAGIAAGLPLNDAFVMGAFAVPFPYMAAPFFKDKTGKSS